MSDVNTTIVDIDRAMDCFEAFQFKCSDFVNMIKFDINQLGNEISYKLSTLRDELDELYDELDEAEEDERDCSSIREKIAEVQQKMAKVEQLKSHQSVLKNGFADDSSQVLNAVTSQTTAGIRDMATYLRKIQQIDAPGGKGNGSGIGGGRHGGSEYRVVIIDSAKYPQSAEHIQNCIRMGYPAVLTLNRDGADENRKQSLAGIPTRSDDGFDRDEYPPAAFLEGGANAHVAYINSSDNQGSGSSFGRQLLNAPNYTRVRFRVI